MNTIPSLLVSLLLLSALASCDSDPSSSNDSSLKGTLKGHVWLKDQDGRSIEDAGGVRVSIEGKNFSTTTTADGSWEITDLPTGTYVMVYEKAGFGTYKKFGYGFIGGGIQFQDPVEMAKAPTVTVSITDVQAVAGPVPGVDGQQGLVTIRGEFSEPVPGGVRGATLYFDTTTSVASGRGVIDGRYGAYAYYGETRFTTSIPAGDLYLMGFAKGTTVYVAAIPMVFRTRYFDPNTRTMVETGTSPIPSQVASFVVP